MALIACHAALALLLSLVPAAAAEIKIGQAGIWDAGERGRMARGMARGAPPEDHYTLMISLYRVSAWDREISWPGSHDSMHEKIRWGPMDVSVRLVPRRHLLYFDSYPLRSVRVRLAQYILGRTHEWLRLDFEKKYIEKLDDMEKGTRGHAHYKALADAMPDLERRMKAIDAHAEDARRILRLLQGIVFYQYGPRPDPAQGRQRKTFQGRDPPISGPVQARFSGAQWRGRKRQTLFDPPSASWWSAEARAKPWSADDVEGERDWRPFIEQSVGMPYHVRALVWRFNPEDMARVRALIADFDAVKKALHEDGYSGAQTTPAAQRHVNFNHYFWEPFLAGLRHVVSFAWIMSPHRPPENMFTDDLFQTGGGHWKPAVLGSAYNVADRILKSGAPLVLPPIVGDTLMQLQVPHRVFASPPPVEKISLPVIHHRISKRKGRRTFEDTMTISFGNTRCTACTSPCFTCRPKPSIEAPGDSDTQWSRHPDIHGSTILISADGTGGAFRGEFSTVWRFERQLGLGYVGYNTEDHRYTYRWELANMGPGIFIAQGAGEGAQP